MTDRDEAAHIAATHALLIEATAKHRSVITHEADDWLYGYRESRKDVDSPWTRDLHSDFVKNTRRFWFQKTPIEIMRDDMGFETATERANEFENGSDNDPAVWYYLGVAALEGAGDEALKWIMGALAAELNIRGLHFTDMPRVLSARILGLFTKAIVDGRIDRTFTKAVFAELVAGSVSEPEAFEALIAEPRFKAISSDDLEPIIDRIIAENPDQYEKAKGNPKLVQFFVGQVMKATQGKAPPPKVIEIMNRKLAG